MLVMAIIHFSRQLILLMGNYMNAGSRNEGSLGFEMNYLTKVRYRLTLKELCPPLKHFNLSSYVLNMSQTLRVCFTVIVCWKLVR